MLRLGVRLSLAGGRRQITVLAVTTLAVAVGVVLLLLALTVAPAMQARANRTAWEQLPPSGSPTVLLGSGRSHVPYTTISTSTDTYHQQSIDVVNLAGPRTTAPTPSWMKALPPAGESLISPALDDLLRRAPDLAGRYGRITGRIPARALPGPDALVAVRSVPAAANALDGVPISGFATHGEVLQLTGVVRLLLLLGAVAMLAPIALFITLSTRLSAASRDRRLAALRLAGATGSQVTQIALVESLLAGIGGLTLGGLLFLAARPVATFVTYDGGRWFTFDLTPTRAGIALVVLGVPLVTVAATLLSLGRVITSPLGVARRTPPRSVRVWRLLPLGVAVPVMGYALASDATVLRAGGRSRLLLAAFTVLLLTLGYAGPYLTQATGMLMARRGGPARLLAGRRLADDPRAGFRTVAGVILAVLVTTMFAATTPAAAESLRSTAITGQHNGTAQAAITSAAPAESAALLADLRALQGISASALVYTGQIQDGQNPANVWIAPCQDIVAATRATGIPCASAPVIVATTRRHLLAAARPRIALQNLSPARLTALGQSPPAGMLTAVTLHPHHTSLMTVPAGIDVPEIIITPTVLGAALTKLRPTLLLLRYDTPAALERARTLILRQVPGSYVNTRQSTYQGYSSDVRRLYRVLAIATLGAFAVAALGLITAIATSLLERRRPFTLLRAAGTPLTTLRRAVILEAGAPLTVMAGLSVLLGALIGHWTVSSGGQSQQLPWLGLTLPVIAGLAVAFLVILTALPLVSRATANTVTDYE